MHVQKKLEKVWGENLTAGGERTVYWMEIDVIHGIHEGLVFRCWCLVAPMTLERKVIPTHKLLISKSLDVSGSEKVRTANPSHRRI